MRALFNFSVAMLRAMPALYGSTQIGGRRGDSMLSPLLLGCSIKA